MAKSRKRQSAKRKSEKRRSAKRQSVGRKSAKRRSARRQPAGRQSAQRRSAADTAERSLIVTLSSDRAIEDVRRDLAAAGLHVEQTLDATRIVTGSADAKHVARLRRVKGVADVSADYPVDIGPPDAEIS